MDHQDRASEDGLIAAFGSELPRLALAWLGLETGKTSRSHAWVDAELRTVVEGVVQEAALALQAEFGWSDPECAGWVASVRQEVNEWAQGDASLQGPAVDRDLGREGPLTAAALLAWRHGIAPHNVARAVAAGLRVQHRDAPDAGVSVPVVLRAITTCCGLRKRDELIPLFLQAYLSSQPESWRAALAAQAFQRAFDYEARYRGCGQATLAGILDTLGVREDGLVRGASAFAGGVALLGDGPCGGFLGAAFSIGWFAGRRRSHLEGDREERYRCFRMTAELRRRYMQTYGSCVCSGVQRSLFGRSYDLWDEADKEGFDAAGAHTTECTRVVGCAAQWALEIVSQPPSRFQGSGPPRPEG